MAWRTVSKSPDIPPDSTVQHGMAARSEVCGSVTVENGAADRSSTLDTLGVSSSVRLKFNGKNLFCWGRGGGCEIGTVWTKMWTLTPFSTSSLVFSGRFERTQAVSHTDKYLRQCLGALLYAHNYRENDDSQLSDEQLYGSVFS